MTPVVRRLGNAVQDEQRLSLAGCHVVEPDAVDKSAPMLDGVAVVVLGDLHY
jgi:hypothetical protein